MKKKFIDENGKLFSKISIIDCLFIILLIAAVIVSVFKILSSNTKNTLNGNAVEVEYTFLAENISLYSYNAILQDDTLFNSPNDKNPIGEITEITKVSRHEYIKNDAGEYVYVDVPDKYDLYIKVKATVYHNQIGYYFKDNIQLLLNQTFTIYNNHVMFTGIVTDIDFK